MENKKRYYVLTQGFAQLERLFLIKTKNPFTVIMKLLDMPALMEVSVTTTHQMDILSAV